MEFSGMSDAAPVKEWEVGNGADTMTLAPLVLLRFVIPNDNGDREDLLSVSPDDARAIAIRLIVEADAIERGLDSPQ